jgi:hypothetical protein
MPVGSSAGAWLALTAQANRIAAGRSNAAVGLLPAPDSMIKASVTRHSQIFRTTRAKLPRQFGLLEISTDA